MIALDCIASMDCTICRACRSRIGIAMRSVLPFVLMPALCAAAGLTAQQSASQDDARAQMDKAIADYRSGDLNHARRELSDFLASHPQDVRAAVLLGYADIKLQRDAEAYEAVAP